MADNPYPDPNQQTPPDQQKKQNPNGWSATGNNVYANGNQAYSFDANNVFNNWDLNPLAQQVGGGAEGVRDSLSTARDAYLQPLMQQYRTAVGTGSGKAAADDQGLFNDPNFQAYVKSGGTQLPQTAMSSWTGTTQQPFNPDMTNQLMQQMMTRQQQQEDADKARGDALYNTLNDRANQSLNINMNDPIIRQQIDAYSAQANKASRDYMANLAESSSPYANLRGEQRLQSENLGRSIGGFGAQVLANELQQRRDQIAQALQSESQFLSADQQNALQKQLGILDQSIKQQGASTDLLRTLLQNQQFNTSQQNQNDQFAANLGFQTADRGNYWDALRSGLITG